MRSSPRVRSGHRFRLALLLALLLPASPARAAGEDAVSFGSDCRPVSGKFTAQSFAPPECTSAVGLCTRGQLTGGLRGTYELTLNTLSNAPEPSVTVAFFTGTSRVSSVRDAFIGVDTGAMNMSFPGTLNSGTFSTLLTITSGASGWLHIQGRLNFLTGAVAGRYNGVVCDE